MRYIVFGVIVVLLLIIVYPIALDAGRRFLKSLKEVEKDTRIESNEPESQQNAE